MREACRRARFCRSTAKLFYISCFYAAIIGLCLLIAADKADAQGAPCLKDSPPDCILKAHIPILSAVRGQLKVFNIYWDDNWDKRNAVKTKELDEATKQLLNSKYFDKLSQYGVKGLGWGGSTDTSNRLLLTCRHTPLPVDMVLSVFAFLDCEEASGPLISGVPLQEAFPTGTCQVCAAVPGGCFSNEVDSKTCLLSANASGNTIYNIFLPNYVKLEDAGGAFVSCKEYSGFHVQIPSLQVGFFAGGTQGRPLYFTVIPTQCFHNVINRMPMPTTPKQELEGIMADVAHELVEAATDPLPLFHWYDESTDPIGRPVALWELDKFAMQSEAADLCKNIWDGMKFVPRPLFLALPPAFGKDPDPPFPVPSYWSNADNGCVAGNLAGFPTIHITSPKSGDSVLWSKQVSFASMVSVSNLNGIVMKWTSNRDGALCTGVTCDAKSLSFGMHTIVATLTDANGTIVNDSIKLYAVSKPPSAFITYPPNDSAFFASQKITLRGFGSSPNENDIPDAHLLWSSTLGGQLPSGHDVLVSLNAGLQTVTLTAVDTLGETGTANITLTVKPSADVPTAEILSPQDNASFGISEVINFQGRGTDPIDGVLPDSSLEWFSSVDGFLGKGKSISVKLTGNPKDLNPVHHQITLRVTNKSAKQGTVMITVTVGSVG
jgi:hypothetical protein